MFWRDVDENLKKGSQNTDIFQAVAPLERPRGIEIFEKCSEFRDPQNPRNPKKSTNWPDLDSMARKSGLTSCVGVYKLIS